MEVCLRWISWDSVGVCLRWFQLDPVFVRLCSCQVGSFLLFIGGDCCSGEVVQWGLSTTFRLSATTRFARLALVLVVVPRWSTDLEFFFTSSVLCTTFDIDE